MRSRDIFGQISRRKVGGVSLALSKGQSFLRVFWRVSAPAVPRTYLLRIYALERMMRHCEGNGGFSGRVGGSLWSGSAVPGPSVRYRQRRIEACTLYLLGVKTLMLKVAVVILVDCAVVWR